MHSHPKSQCFYRVLQGGFSESRFQNRNNQNEQDKKLVEVGRFDLDLKNNIGYIEDNIGYHNVEIGPQDSVSLHVYSPPYDTCKVYHDDQEQDFKISNTTEHGRLIH